MNTVQLVGVIASDIRLQEFTAKTAETEGKTKASFLVAVRRPPRDAEPDWIRVETWGRQAHNLVRFNGKGSRIAVRGRLRGQFYNPDGGARGGQLRTVVVADEIVYLQARRGAPEEATTAAQGEPARHGRVPRARTGEQRDPARRRPRRAAAAPAGPRPVGARAHRGVPGRPPRRGRE